MSALRVSGAAPRIALVLEKLLGAPSPLRIRAWDGTESGPDDAPALIVRSRRAIRRLLWRPDEIGLARAWVAGELDLEGDLEQALTSLEAIGRDLTRRRHLTTLERAEVYRAAVL